MDLDSEELLTEIRNVNNEITLDLEGISQNLDSFQGNFNMTISFFEGLDNNLEFVTYIYEEYQLYIVLYIVLGVIALLLAIKLFLLIFNF